MKNILKNNYNHILKQYLAPLLLSRRSPWYFYKSNSPWPIKKKLPSIPYLFLYCYSSFVFGASTKQCLATSGVD